MIADLDESIKKLLIAGIPIKNGEIDIKFEQPTREWSAKLARPTVNFFLYDVRENVTLRQHQWETIKKNGNGRIDMAHLKRTPFRVDCYYMITTWAAKPDDEHRLLSRLLRALFRNPIITEEFLVGEMKTQEFDVTGRVASHDKLTNPAEVWSALDNELRPSISYLLTIAIDPWAEVSGPAVHTFTLRAGLSPDPRRQSLDPDAGLASEKIYIGGYVLQKGSPQPDIQVAIKGTGFVDTTDRDGRFRLGGLYPGEFTLIAWPEKGKPQERTITLPLKEGDYNIDL
ncbi:MAG: Pvc16 family protein [Chloroflexota bacterium]